MKRDFYTVEFSWAGQNWLTLSDAEIGRYENEQKARAAYNGWKEVNVYPPPAHVRLVYHLILEEDSP